MSAKRRKENDADSQNSFENVNSNEADLSQTMNKDSDIGTDSTSPSDDEEEKARKKAEEKALLEKNEDCPVLFTGGSLRQYQKDGYKWLKVKFRLILIIVKNSSDVGFMISSYTCTMYCKTRKFCTVLDIVSLM